MSFTMAVTDKRDTVPCRTPSDTSSADFPSQRVSLDHCAVLSDPHRQNTGLGLTHPRN